jgi:hypothetical protein
MEVEPSEPAVADTGRLASTAPTKPHKPAEGGAVGAPPPVPTFDLGEASPQHAVEVHLMPVEPESEKAEDMSVEAWLNSIKLDRYHEKIVEKGYDELEFLKDADEEDINEMIETIGMKKPHIKTFLKNLALLTGGS